MASKSNVPISEEPLLYGDLLVIIRTKIVTLMYSERDLIDRNP